MAGLRLPRGSGARTGGSHSATARIVQAVIPVRSDPVIPPLPPAPLPEPPDVGLRWGAPADFLTVPSPGGFGSDTDEAGGSGEKLLPPGYNAIYEPEKIVKKIAITDYTEIWRRSWSGDIDADKSVGEELIPIQETQRWMIPDGSYQERDRSRLAEVDRTVNVFYEFRMPPAPQVQFAGATTDVDAGERPKGV